MTITHGTRYAYQRLACRCDDCRRANTEYCRKSRGAPVPPTPKSQIHGTVNRYEAGCRCLDCRDANTKYRRRIREAQPTRRAIDPRSFIKPPPDFLDGVQAPCYAPANDLRDWTDDDHLVRREAAKKCADCPVIAACYAHGKKHREFGVWGGVDLGGAS